MGNKGNARWTGDGVFSKPVAKRWKGLGVLALAGLAALLVATTSNAAETANLHITGVTIVGPPNGQTAAAPASRVDYSVSGATSNGANWNRTAYRIDGGSWTCIDSGSGGTRTIPGSDEITLPGLPGNHTIEFRMHQSNSCSEASPYSAVFKIDPALAPRTSNPNLAEACGSLNVVLILDESGSITDTPAYVTNVKDAAKAFVNGLKGTGANLAVVEFDATATKPLGSTYIPISDPVPASWTNYIDNQYGSNDFWSSGTYTNWQDALSKTAEIDATANADLVVFITDGDPTAYGVSPAAVTTGQPDGYFTGLKPAFDLANSLKAGGSHMLAVGVGNAVGGSSDAPNKKLRLKGVSDDEELALDASNIKTADVAFVTNFADLEAALSNLATALCRSSVTILKQVDEADGQGYKPVSGSAAGWQFTPAVTVSSGNLAWELGGPGPASTTAPDGVTFQWKPSNLAATSDATFTETVQQGYTLTGVTCTPAVTLTRPTSSSFFIDDLPFKGSTTCTVKNKRNTGTIQLMKQFVGASAGATADLYIKQGGVVIQSGAGFKDEAQSGQGTAVLTVAAGTFDISELDGASTPLSGYVPTYACIKNGQPWMGPTPGSSASVEVLAGENIACTFTNTKRGSIKLVKTAVGGDGTFPFTNSGITGLPATLTTSGGTANATSGLLVPGSSYAVAEGALPVGWDFSSASCKLADGTTSTGAVAVKSITAITVESGKTTTCTFTNTKRGRIIVDKVTLPAQDPQSFGFAAGGVGYGNFALTDAAAPNDQEVVPGAYSVAESVPTGWDQTSAVCDKGETVGSLDVEPGETVTCTFTNTKRGSIKLVKTAVGGDGTFPFTNSGITGLPATLTTSGGTANATSGLLVPGSSYAVAEGALPAGWDFSSASCKLADGTTSTGAVAVKSITAITVESGKTTTCTFTNTKGGSIIVEKQTLPDGDVATFGFSGELTATLGDGQSSSKSVAPGTYSVTEAAKAGWDLTNITCDDGNSSGVLATGVATFNVAAGETVKCTYTNTKGGSIKLVKTAVGGDGTFAFTHSIAGLESSLTTVSGTASDTSDALVPGSSYAVAEGALPVGWDFSSASCKLADGTTSTGAVAVKSITAITVESGKTTTCTFTNTKRGRIVVDKVTLPAQDPQSFGFAAGGVGYGNFALTDAAAPNDQEVVPGAYSVAESVPTGWDQTSAVCDKGETVGSLDVEPGETVTCTFTNTKRGSIIVEKQTLPDGDVATFGFSGELTATLGDGQSSSKSVAPGTYSVTEAAKAGWDLTNITCDDGNSSGVLATGVATFNVAAGETVKCTYTNTKRGHVVVKKLTLPSGDPQSFAFSASGSGYAGFGLADGGSNDQQLKPGQYSATEAAVEGWDLKEMTCDDQASTTPSVRDGLTATINVEPGETVTCTFTNSKRPLVKVVKEVVPEDDGGTFKLGINDQVFTNGGAGFGDGQGTDFVPVPVGDVTVSENDHAPTLVSSYFNDVTCDSEKGGLTGTPHANRSHKFTIGYGEKVTCTFTNTRKPASIDVTKTPDPTTVSEPGGSVKYTVAITNTSEVDKVHLTAAGFVDKVATNNPAIGGAVVPITDLDCNDGVAGDGFPLTINVGGSAICMFNMSVTGNAGAAVNDRITVTGKDDANRDVMDFAEATVNIVNVDPAIEVQKTVTSDDSFAESAALPEPGGNFTYKIVVTNASSASSDPLTITELNDDVYGDVTKATPDNAKVVSTTCNTLIGTVLAKGASAECQFVAPFTGNPGAAETDTVTATGQDDDGQPATDTDTAHVSITDIPSSITVTKTPSPTSVAEPGGPVTYTVVVKNTSPTDDVILTAESFTDKVGDGSADPVSVDCNGDTAGSGLPVTLHPNDAVTCTFEKPVAGNAGDIVHDEVTVTGTDDDGGHPTKTGTADVPVSDVPTKLSVVKDASPGTVQEGTRAITFTVTITNVLTFTQNEQTYTAVDDITVFSLQDNKLGDLDAAGDVVCKVGGVTKTWPMMIGPGQSIVCTVTRNVTGTPSTPHSNTATATGYDSDHPNGCAESSVEPFCKIASGNATVRFTATPPPAYVAHSDVTVTKTATPAVQLPAGGGTAPIAYTIAAKNNGPDPAANVHVADAAPAGVTFVSATTGKGTCTTTAQAVDCTISSLAVGESVPITINATVSATGTKTNVVIVTTTTPETNTTNNTASASTVVTAPLTPPKPPKPAAEICELLTVTPKMLKGNGKAQKVNVKVTKGEKPVVGAKVKIMGPGISKMVKTGKNGKVTVTLKPGKPGIIRVAIQGAKTCNQQRIGVVGVNTFEPPVTG